MKRDSPTPTDRVEIVPLTAQRWDDFVNLFMRRGPRGGGSPGSSGCWCMWWRDRGRPADNRMAMERNVKSGSQPGLLAYQDGQAIGWISVAPREQFGQLMQSRSYAPRDAEAGIWYITCVYVHGSERRKGVARSLCEAAIAYAKNRGARAIDAFPATIPARSDYMGSLSLYEELGFQAVRNVSTRTLVRLHPAG